MNNRKKIVISIIIIISLLLLGTGVYIYDKTTRTENTQKVTPSPTDPTSTTKDYPQTEIIAENLSVPWDIAFLPDGDILFTERAGNLKRLYITSDKHIETVGVIKNVKQVGESGLHGIAIDPNYLKNNFIYLYYTYETNGNESNNRVSRFTYIDDKLSDETIIVDEIPGAMFHDGGRIRFGPDGYLYITTGDAQESSLAQDTEELAGKILRVTSDGSPAPGNPFGNLIYTYGHRNPQGITWDDHGNLWETEHGPSGFGVDCCRDEVNLILSGENYGWPTITGSQTQEGLISPATNSGILETWAPASLAYTRGSLYFGGLRGESLYQATLDGTNVQEVLTHFNKKFGRIRAVTLGPDSMLYISTSNRDGRGIPKTGDDKIIRVNPTKL